MNIAVLLAAGTGLRMQSDTPKQFLKIAGKMVIEHTLEAFQNHPMINAICIVHHPQHCSTIEPMTNNKQFNKINKIICGGKYRTDSTKAAFNLYNSHVNLIIHDAVRPMVTARIITDTVTALQKYNAVAVAIPAIDTIMQVEKEHMQAIPFDRHLLMHAQTPQGFKQNTLKRAYELMANDPNFRATDDCTIVKKYLPNETIFVVQGERTNIKLTDQQDIFILEQLLNSQK